MIRRQHRTTHKIFSPKHETATRKKKWEGGKGIKYGEVVVCTKNGMVCGYWKGERTRYNLERGGVKNSKGEKKNFTEGESTGGEAGMSRVELSTGKHPI